METSGNALQRLIERASGLAITRVAVDAGLLPSTLTRQLKRGRVDPQSLVAICRRFDIDLLDAFVAAGYITQAEADALGARGALELATDQQLAGEILRRLSAGTAGAELTEPIGSVTPIRANLSEGPPRISDDELADERSVANTPKTDAGENQDDQ